MTKINLFVFPVFFRHFGLLRRSLFFCIGIVRDGTFRFRIRILFRFRLFVFVMPFWTFRVFSLPIRITFRSFNFFWIFALLFRIVFQIFRFFGTSAFPFRNIFWFFWIFAFSFRRIFFRFLLGFFLNNGIRLRIFVSWRRCGRSEIWI